MCGKTRSDIHERNREEDNGYVQRRSSSKVFVLKRVTECFETMADFVTRALKERRGAQRALLVALLQKSLSSTLII